jgi:hypothetical protein
MNIKNALLLTSMALASAALVLPVGASATMLYHNGKPIEGEEAPIKLSGTINVKSASGGVDCKHHLTVDPGTADAKVTKVETTTLTCVGTGPYLGCTVISDQATNLPYTADYVGSTFVVTDTTIDYELNCFLKSFNFSVGELVLTADNAEAIKKFSVSGEGLVGETAAEISGELEVVGEASGQYSLK